MRGLEQSRPVLAAAPGAALAVPFTTRMQVGLVAHQMRRLLERRLLLSPLRCSRLLLRCWAMTCGSHLQLRRKTLTRKASSSTPRGAMFHGGCTMHS